MFLLETLKLMLAPVPASAAAAGSPRRRLPTASNVAHLIGQRIERLSPMAVKLARCAAIAGADFSADLAAHVLGLRAIDLSDAWSELDAAQVLRDGAFAHDLIFEAARGSVPAPIARQLHARWPAISRRGGRAGARRQHWRDAGERLKACPGWSPRPSAPAPPGGRRGRRAAAARRPHRPRRGPGPGRAFELLRARHRAHLQAQPRQPGAPRVPRPAGDARGRPAGARLRHFARSDTLAQQAEGAPPRPRRARPGGDRRRAGGRPTSCTSTWSRRSPTACSSRTGRRGRRGGAGGRDAHARLGDRRARDRALRQPRRPARREQLTVEARPRSAM
jgi:hypothetical protein